jgi:HAAS
MSQNLIEWYLSELERRLRRQGLSDSAAMAEIEGHLYQSVEAGQRRGLSQAEAERQALQRFGPVTIVAASFTRQRMSLMQKALLAIAVICGLFITYVDTRPTWDDTGITAGAILIICGLIALLEHRRPWLVALGVGLWIPLYGLLFAHSFGAIMALAFAFAGAYAGWAVRAGAQQLFHIA